MTGPAMPQNNPLALIATLSEIKDRRRQMDIMESANKQAAATAAARLGFEKDSENYKRIQDLMAQIVKGDTASRPAYEEMASMLNVDPGVLQAMHHLSTATPQSLDALRIAAANHGQANMAGTPQGIAAQNDAYTTATSGQNNGAVAGSAFSTMVQNAANHAFANLTPAQQTDMLRQNLSKNLTGMSQAGAAVDSGMANSPAAIAKMVATSSGQDLTASQAATTTVGQQGNAAQIYATNAQLLMKGQDLAQQLLTNKVMLGYVSPSDKLLGLQHLMDNIKQQVSTPNPNDRTALQGLYNHVATTIGMPELTSGDPMHEITAVQAEINRLTGSGQVTANPTNPIAAMSGTGQAPPTTPTLVPSTMSPFVQRPPQ